jgi:hypothetical protein
VYADIAGPSASPARIFAGSPPAREGGGTRFAALFPTFDDDPAKGAAFIDAGFDSHPKVRIRGSVASICDTVTCASKRFFTAHRLFGYAALNSYRVDMAGAFTENLIKSVQNSPNFGGVCGSSDNMVHNQ